MTSSAEQGSAGTESRPQPRWRLLAGALLAVALVAALAAGGAQARVRVRLRYSSASNAVVQRQPRAGSCHAIGRGLDSRPDPRCTPGALNPAVTQADIGRTICRSGWTRTVRPPEWITEAEKRASLLAYGDARPIWTYEYDHLVPLELGGATNAPANLWPEPGASPNPKDTVEDELNQAVCDHRLTLAKAQHEIAADWVRLARHDRPAPPPSQPAPSQPSPSPSGSAGASCSVSAAWNGEYDNYDVYVRSNQPDAYAQVTGAGHSAGYDTNRSGYADVYFDAGASDAGAAISVAVGSARCTGTL